MRQLRPPLHVRQHHPPVVQPLHIYIILYYIILYYIIYAPASPAAPRPPAPPARGSAPAYLHYIILYYIILYYICASFARRSTSASTTRPWFSPCILFCITVMYYIRLQWKDTLYLK